MKQIYYFWCLLATMTTECKEFMGDLSKEAQQLAIVVSEYDGSVRKLADVLKVHHSNISRMLRGERSVPLELIKRISLVLGYNPEWLISGTSPKMMTTDQQNNIKVIDESILQHTVSRLEVANSILEAKVMDLNRKLTNLKEVVIHESALLHAAIKVINDTSGIDLYSQLADNRKSAISRNTNADNDDSVAGPNDEPPE